MTEINIIKYKYKSPKDKKKKSMGSTRPAVVRRLLQALQRVAPLELAGSWDNVGLLLDAPNDKNISKESKEYRVFITNDLTEKVAQEAVRAHANFIVSYHPTPFKAMRRIDREDPASRVVMTCMANGISVYSPHTALDCVYSGVNDWLLEAFGGEAAGWVAAITPADPDSTRIEGEGRVLRFEKSVTLEKLISDLKKHLELPHVRVAPAMNLMHSTKCTPDSVSKMASEHLIGSIAVCAGSGGSVLSNQPDVDVWLTGEMSHHEVLAANAQGKTVILTDHSNTERGYLPRLRSRLESELDDIDQEDDGDKLSVSFAITQLDSDPLVVV